MPPLSDTGRMGEREADAHALSVFRSKAIASVSPLGVAGPESEVLRCQDVLPPLRGEPHYGNPARSVLLGPLHCELIGSGAAFRREDRQGMAFREGTLQVLRAEGIPAGQVRDDGMKRPLARCRAVSDRVVGGRGCSNVLVPRTQPEMSSGVKSKSKFGGSSDAFSRWQSSLVSQRPSTLISARCQSGVFSAMMSPPLFR